MGSIKRRLLPFVAAGALAIGIAAPVAAAPPGPIIVGPGGLVNVVLVDTIDITDVTVQLPLAVAANVCGIDVNVLADQVEAGDNTCEAGSDARANR
jgi:hypothetical protein